MEYGPTEGEAICMTHQPPLMQYVYSAMLVGANCLPLAKYFVHFTLSSVAADNVYRDGWLLSAISKPLLIVVCVCLLHMSCSLVCPVLYKHQQIISPLWKLIMYTII